MENGKTNLKKSEKLSYEAEKLKKREKFLFFEKIEKKTRSFFLFMLLLCFIWGWIAWILRYFDVIQQRLANDVMVVLVWIMVGSFVTYLILAFIRISYDDDSGHDVYPNLM